MSKHYIGTSRNQRDVYVYLVQSPLASNVARNPHLLSLLKEAVAELVLSVPAARVEHDMKRTIGYADQLLTQDKDVVFYACQVKSRAYTRFVKNRKADETSHLTITLYEDEDGEYEVRTAWLGKDFPPMPGEEGETEHSQEYWDTHAVIFNGQPILANTITKQRPY